MVSKNRKLLIIEDEEGDYSEIMKVFVNKSWEFLPDKLEDFLKWKDILKSGEEDFIRSHYLSIIKENYKDIGLIILDLALIGDHDQLGIKLLETIRRENPNDIERFVNWRKKVPIIALTKWDIPEYIDAALGGKYSVDYYYIKDSVFQAPLNLVLTCEVAYANFMIRKKERPIGENIKNLSSEIGKIKEEIVSQFFQLQAYLDPKFSGLEDIKKCVSILIFEQLKIMGIVKAEKFVNEFSSELSFLDPLYQTKIQEVLVKPDFKEQFIGSIKNGDLASFTDLLDKVFYRLEDSGIISSLPILKFILPGLLALLKIISHND